MRNENSQSSAPSASRRYATCPRCDGSGEVTVVFVTSQPRSKPPIGEFECDACHGEGKVTQYKLSKMKRGEAFRKYRVTVCGLGLREAAKRWGIRAVELSEIEQGVRQTAWIPPGFEDRAE
jgi:RecJ-like exonuclease